MTGNYFLSSFFESICNKKDTLLSFEKILFLLELNFDEYSKNQLSILRTYYDILNVKACLNGFTINPYGNLSVSVLKSFISNSGRSCPWLENIYDNNKQHLFKEDISVLLCDWLQTIDKNTQVYNVIRLNIFIELLTAFSINDVYDLNNFIDQIPEMFKNDVKREFESQKSLQFDTLELIEEFKRHKDDPVHLTSYVSQWSVSMIEKRRLECPNTLESILLFFIQYVIYDKLNHSINSLNMNGFLMETI